MWHRSYASKVLTNPALIGTLVPHEVVYENENGKRVRKALQPVEDYFPRVVSREEWDDLTAMLSTGCHSAWNKDPVFGVIGIQSGPRG